MEEYINMESCVYHKCQTQAGESGDIIIIIIVIIIIVLYFIGEALATTWTVSPCERRRTI